LRVSKLVTDAASDVFIAMYRAAGASAQAKARGDTPAEKLADFDRRMHRWNACLEALAWATNRLGEKQLAALDKIESFEEQTGLAPRRTAPPRSIGRKRLVVRWTPIVQAAARRVPRHRARHRRASRSTRAGPDGEASEPPPAASSGARPADEQHAVAPHLQGGRERTSLPPEAGPYPPALRPAVPHPPALRPPSGADALREQAPQQTGPPADLCDPRACADPPGPRAWPECTASGLYSLRRPRQGRRSQREGEGQRLAGDPHDDVREAAG